MRLRLFVIVCQAVQHAHHKGIIHRDIKPSNIMVTLHDGAPVLKVIDFGVAKAINQRLTEKTLFTAYGQMVGTPQYMSPEQAEMSGLDVDTRSDVYSLGVLLYELLTGTTPLEAERLRQAGYAEMQRIIRDEEPPKPSVRLSTAGEQLTVIAKHRSIDPRRLRQLVRGELDWVVMKSLEKDRVRRYDAAGSLAADIDRFLTGEAVGACPPSILYRWRKLAYRHKAALAVATFVTLALLCGVIVASWQARRAITAERVMRAEKSRAEKERDRAADAVQQQRALTAQLDASLTVQTTLTEQAQQEAERRRRLLYIADMNVAQEAWDRNDVKRAVELLDSHRPGSTAKQTDLRGVEWYLLRRLCENSTRVEKRIHLTYGARQLALSPTDGRLVVGLHNNTVAIVNPQKGRQVETFGPQDHTCIRHTLSSRTTANSSLYQDVTRGT